MNVGTNNYVAGNRHVGLYNRHLIKQNDEMTKLSTGMRIRSARDGASTYAITEKMLSQIRANDQANENSQNNATLLRTAQDALSNDLSIMSTLQATAIKSANDTNNETDRTKIVEEVKQLLKQIDDNANKTKYNGKYLLNGMLDGSSATSKTSTAESVTASGTYGDKAVYSITGFMVADTAADASGTQLKVADADTALVSLLDSSGKALFNLGDQITATWTENGVEKSQTINVEANTKLSALNKIGTVQFLKGPEGTTAGGDTGAVMADGTTKVLATENGYYITGAADKNISNVSFAVTNSSGATNTAAQAALKPTAIQQSYGNEDYGTSEVYNVAAAASKDNATSQFYEFGNATDSASSSYTLSVDGKQITFSGANTISEINDMLKENDINVRLQYAAAGDKLYYDGEEVTKGTYGGVGDYTATAGLNFITAPGTTVGQIAFTDAPTGSQFKDKATNAASGTDVITRELKLDVTSELSGSSSSSSLPQSNPLWFQVGEDANFGISFSIGIATVKNLFGTDADTFASKFATSDGAKSTLDTIQNAIDKVLVEQTRLGSMESRMGYISESLESMSTNTQSSYETMRSSDPAKTMVEYTKYSVLSQMAQVMLALSNQNASGAINLLKP